jgi:hypothetical protein
MLFIARISRQKGLPMLLSAMNALRDKLDGWLLVIGGADQDGHQMEVRELVRTLGLEEHVVFAGPLFGETKLDAFAASEVFVLPSHCEGSPMIVLEAMAGRMPVLCTKAASWGELEIHACGWWPDIDETAVRNALEDVFSKSTAELEQMGERAHRLAASEYTWKVAAERSANLYAVGWHFVTPTRKSARRYGNSKRTMRGRFMCAVGGSRATWIFSWRMTKRCIVCFPLCWGLSRADARFAVGLQRSGGKFERP